MARICQLTVYPRDRSVGKS